MPPAALRGPSGGAAKGGLQTDGSRLAHRRTDETKREQTDRAQTDRRTDQQTHLPSNTTGRQAPTAPEWGKRGPKRGPPGKKQQSTVRHNSNCQQRMEHKKERNKNSPFGTHQMAVLAMVGLVGRIMFGMWAVCAKNNFRVQLAGTLLTSSPVHNVQVPKFCHRMQELVHNVLV